MTAQDGLFDLPLGEEAKRRGLELAGSSEVAWPWRQRADAALWELASRGVPFTADDLVRLVGLPDYGVNRNNAVGAVFSAASKRRWIVPTGSYRKSRRALSHARVIAVWAGNPERDFD